MCKNEHLLRVNVKNSTFLVLLEEALLIRVVYGTNELRVINDLIDIWVQFMAVAGVFVA